MPILTVYGIPESMSADLPMMTKSLTNNIAGIKELNLMPSEISVFYPRDLMQEGLGEEIIVFVDGLFDKPERTEAVRKKLAETVAKNILMFIQGTNLVECLIRPFKPEQGFCSISNV